MQRRRGADPSAVFLLWEQEQVGVSGGGGARCRPGNVGGRVPARNQGSVGKRDGEECERRRAEDVSGVSFSGGSTTSVVVADVVSAAADVVSTLAEGSICQVLLTLIYPVIIKIIVRP